MFEAQRSRSFRRALGVALVLTAVASCGGDDSSTGSNPPIDADVTVVAKDISFPQTHFTAEAGPVDIAYEDQGHIPHTLKIEGVDDFELKVNSHGDVDEGTVDLDAGEYTIYCDIPGHRAAGMEATLVVS
jgi:uncharacterized cupredoxin-like copper-binding protein